MQPSAHDAASWFPRRLEYGSAFLACAPATTPGAVRACRAARRRSACHAPLARHVHAGRAPHDRVLRHVRGHGEPHARGILPVLRRGAADFRSCERPLRAQTGARSGHPRLRAGQRRMRTLDLHRHAHRDARASSAGRGRGERGVHRGGEGRRRARAARGAAVARAGDVRGRAGAGAGGGRARFAGGRLAHDVLGARRHRRGLQRAGPVVRRNAARRRALRRRRGASRASFSASGLRPAWPCWP